MKCALIMSEWTSTPTSESFEPRECLKAECGQYDQVNECCAPVALNQTMVAIGNVLGALVIAINRTRYTFRCHHCGMTVQATPIEADDVPAGWKRLEQVDGHLIWVCAPCLKHF